MEESFLFGKDKYLKDRYYVSILLTCENSHHLKILHGEEIPPPVRSCCFFLSKLRMFQLLFFFSLSPALAIERIICSSLILVDFISEMIYLNH